MIASSSRMGPKTAAQCLRTSSTMNSPWSAMRNCSTLGSSVNTLMASRHERAEEPADRLDSRPHGADGALDGVRRILGAGDHVEEGEDHHQCDHDSLDPLHASVPFRRRTVGKPPPVGEPRQSFTIARRRAAPMIRAARRDCDASPTAPPTASTPAPGRGRRGPGR